MTTPEDSATLREKYAKLGMSGMVALIDHVVDAFKSGRKIVSVGSSTIDLHGLTKCKNMTEQEMFETIFFRLNKLHFGSDKRDPLEDIASAYQPLAEAPEFARKRIDEIVGEFARLGNSLNRHFENELNCHDSPDFEEVDPLTADDDLEAIPAKHLLH